MTRITSLQTRKIHEAFKFLTLSYYKELGQYRAIHAPKSSKNRRLGYWEYESSIEFELTTSDLAEMKMYTTKYVSCLLKDAEDEIVSNLYSIQDVDRITYLDSYKMEFYSICLLSSVYTFQMNLKIGNSNFIQLKKSDKKTIEDYLEAVSSLAYQWSYQLYWREQLLRGYLPQIKVIIPPRGKLLRTDLIYNILFAYDLESDAVNEEAVDLEKPFLDGELIIFTKNTLNKFLSNSDLKEGELLNWIYKKNSKDKQPYILGLVIFCLVLFPSETLNKFTKNKDIANYITNNILLDGKRFEMDVSNISKANATILAKNINIETLKNYFSHLNQCQ